MKKLNPHDFLRKQKQNEKTKQKKEEQEKMKIEKEEKLKRLKLCEEYEKKCQE